MNINADILVDASNS